MIDIMKNIAFLAGKIWELLAFTIRTISFGAVKSSKAATKSANYVNRVTTAARELKDEAGRGRQVQRSQNQENPL